MSALAKEMNRLLDDTKSTAAIKEIIIFLDFIFSPIARIN